MVGLRHTAGFYLDDALYSDALLLAGEKEE
jgi:hypothetical protein